MKKVIFSVFMLLATLFVAMAQPPQKMTYQVVVRDTNNELVVNQHIGIQVTILEDNANGPIIYRETHSTTTNANALATIIIGTGVHAYVNTLEDVNWGQHDHYLRVDIDPHGGTNYTVTGTQQLISVPYSFYAESTKYVDTAIYTKYADTALFAYSANYADSSNYNNLANRPPDGTNKGDILYWETSDSSWHIIPAGNIGEVLTMDTNNVPYWSVASGGGGAQISLPAVKTDSVNNVTGYSATAMGTVTSGGGTTLVFSGICWSTQHNPSLSDNYMSSGIGVNNFTSNITGLLPNTTYYVRAFATNNAGTVYGAEISFKTIITLPIVTTDKVIAVSGTAATSGGNVISEGGDSVSARGVCWSISSNPTISSAHTSDGNGLGNFISNMTGLTQAKTYYVRAYATNILGTAYGDEITFTTPTIPTVVTDSTINVTSSSATIVNNITNDGGDPPSVRGICWNTTGTPTLVHNYTTDGSGTGVYTSTLTGLSPYSVYFIRAYATNIAGTGYDNSDCWIEIYDNNLGYYYDIWSTGSVFVTAPLASNYNTQACPGAPTVTDNSGNSYNTIQIGTQCWMKENLKTTMYGSNNPIPLGTTTSTTVAYRYYPNNDSSNVATYGYLYNGSAATLNGICPSGWHVPTDAEWTTLTSYVSSQSQYCFTVGTSTYSIYGKSLASNTGWNNYNYSLGPGNSQSSNNVTGFSAMPAGSYNNNYNGFRSYAYFWTTTTNGNNLISRNLNSYSVNLSSSNYTSRSSGYSIRCLKN